MFFLIVIRLKLSECTISPAAQMTMNAAQSAKKSHQAWYSC